MPVRDLGVSPDYVDRAFRALESEAGESGDPKGHLGDIWRARRVQLTDLAAIQAHRPLSRPGTGANFGFVSPMAAAVMRARRWSAENGRQKP